MKVLIQTPPHERHLSVVQGWTNVLDVVGYPYEVWDGVKPAFDAFGEFKPDLYVETRRRTSTVAKALEKFPKTKVSLQQDFRPAFDSIAYKPGVVDGGLSCDVAFVGDYRADKRSLLDSYTLPLIRSGLDVKLFGRTPWGLTNWLGYLPPPRKPDLVASAGVCLNLSQGRLSERAYQVLGLEGFLISNTPGDLGNGVCVVTPDKIVETCKYFLRPTFDYLTSSWKVTSRYAVLGGQTYFHRVAGMFGDAGFADEEERVLGAIGDG